jgi:hypothetical protein
MEPLLLAVICGCNAGLFCEALHEVYIPRIQRGNAAFTANVALVILKNRFYRFGATKPFTRKTWVQDPLCAQNPVHPPSDVLSSSSPQKSRAEKSGALIAG